MKRLCEIRDMKSEDVIESLYTKSKEWQHENEFRAVYYSRLDNSDIWNTVDGEVYLMANVTKVVFGLFAEKNVDYISALRVLRDANLHRKQYGISQIEVTKCRLNRNNYGISENKQFDYLKELEQQEEHSA